MIKHCFFLILLFFSFTLCFAQHPFYYNITDEDGLPSNEVYSIVQDDFGYIWIGCDAGLFRYDGFNFKPYINSKQNGRSISFLQLDKKGRLWCKNFSGQIYRVEKDSLFIVKDFSEKSSSTPQFTLDDECKLYVNNFNKIEIYNEKGDSLRAFIYSERENEIADINELIFLNDKIYFCRQRLGFFAVDIRTGNTEQIDCSENCADIWVKLLFRKLDDELFVLAENTVEYKTVLVKIKGAGMELIRRSDKDISRAYMICRDRNKDNWLCTSTGVKSLENNNHSSLFKDQKVSNMLHDREGNYWLTTLEHGLFVIPHMEVQRMSSSNSELREDNFTSVIKLNNGNLFAGSYTGELYEINKNTAITVFADAKQKFITVKKIRETEDYLLVSRGRFTIIEKKTGKTFYPPLSNFRDMTMLGDTLFFVLPETSGKISMNDLLKNEEISFTQILKGGGRTVEADTITGSVYFALNDGTFIYRQGKMQELKIGEEKIYANALSFSNEMLWVASVSKGIYGIKGDQVIHHFSSENGLHENNMRCIKANGKNIIACSDNFLYSINTNEASISKYNITSGINPKDINAIEFDDSLVALATNKGLVYFPLSLQSVNSVEPNISIINITHADSVVGLSSSVSLSYRNNNFRIYFSSAAFRSRGKFTYEYRLKGLDSTWVSTSASVNYAVFSSIPPGEFLFEVRAVNESGVKSKNVVSVAISVSSPVWQQWWFYLLVSLFSVGLVVLIYQFRIRYLTRKAALQNKLTASQLTALKAQMNPHFMYNALNSIQDLILQSDIKNTNYYLSRFSSLMRKVLDASGSNEITLNDEVEMLELYLELEKLRFGNDFTYSVSVQKGIDKDETKLPSMILQLFVENAIKHGLLHKKGEKKLSVEFILKDNSMICVVTDNGVGRKRAQEIKERSSLKHGSFATKATEKRLELINSTRQKKIKLEVIDLTQGEIAVGTKVILEVPL